MLERLKWLTVMVTIAVVIMGTQTILENFIAQPALAVEPTHTSTLPPAATPVPTQTSSPPAAKAAVPGVRIVEISSETSVSDLADEYIVIENRLNEPVELDGWTLRDDEKNIFTFPHYSLGAGKVVRVWTRIGVNRVDNLYWNSAEKVWNSGGDCGYLRSADGDLQNYLCY